MQHQFKCIGEFRAVRLPRVCELTGASSATIWRWVRADGAFPKPFSISTGITAWDESEIISWLEAKKSRRGVV